jgi:bifunctional UDP-N-acetylglucosamine pyrophosphorylase/glucosamine-1-phosphate N-acetyltransferase
MAAGRGSRMIGFGGNKTLLPLIPEESPFRGTRPILLQILDSLPPGPKALVVHYGKNDVIDCTKTYDLTYWEQPTLNGTGGALMAARPFFFRNKQNAFLITMGDVPFVRTRTYHLLVEGLQSHHGMVLGFRPKEKRQYGVLDMVGNRVTRILEWKYWSALSAAEQARFDICNAGIYAFRRDSLLRYLSRLQDRPHQVNKARDGAMKGMEEFFITDLVELMNEDGLSVGLIPVENDYEVMGVDDLEALKNAQQIYAQLHLSGRKAPIESLKP